MSTNDPELGKKIKQVLESQQLDGPFGIKPIGPTLTFLACTDLIVALGGDVENDSLKETPARMAKMYQEEICYGLNYNNFPRVMLQPVEGYDEIILERNIKVHSLCEHHFVPIIGVAHVAYIPKTHIIGLSKLNRIVDFFARRPQVQERLGEQITIALREILQIDDVAVIIKADHFCVKYRGVEDPCSDTVTSVMEGRFRSVPEARAELMALIAL